MNTAALGNLTKIKDIKSTSAKITSQYRITAAPITPKNKLIVKTFTFSERINKPELLKKQIALTKGIQCIHPIKQLYIEDSIESQELLMIEEYLPNGNLTECIDATWKINIEFLRTIALTIGQLHSRSIYHLNLKPQNILLEGKDTVRFTDQRLPYLYSLFRKSKLSFSGSPYIPPQADGPDLGEEKWDVWSLGIIFMELALHRRIQYHEIAPQALYILTSQIQDDALRNVIKGMICERDLRYTISEVIQRLKEGKSEQKRQMDNQSYVHTRLNLFACNVTQKLPLSVKQQTFCVKIDTWMFSITLMHMQSNLYALWVTAIGHGRGKSFINIVYSSLPSSLQGHFVDWETFYNVLITTKPQNFKLEKEGYLAIKMKIYLPIKRQPQPITTSTQQKIANPSQIVVNQPQLLQKSKIEFKDNQPQIKQKVESHQKLAQQSQPDETDLIFDSDTEIEIFSAYKSFSKSHQAITDISQRIAVMTKVQQPDIDLISMSYEQMGECFYDLDDFKQAKRAYKLARQGYIRIHNKESVKEMNLLIELGNTYSKLADFPKSIRCFRKSAFIAKEKGEYVVLVIAYKNWANVAVHINDYQTAEKCYLKCVEICSKKQESSQYLMEVYVNLSNIYLKNQEYAKSNESIRNYIRLNRNSKGGKMGILNFNLGFGMLHLHQFKDAFQAIRLSLGEKYKESMRTEMENIFLGVFRKKKQMIKQQFDLHKEAITSLRKLLQSPSQKTLDTLLQ